MAGRLAAYVPSAPGQAVRVTLRRPPPLDTPIEVEPGPGGAVTAVVAGSLVAQAQPTPLDAPAVEPVPYHVAQQTARGFAGLRAHPFPTCFTCGTARSAPDGLALRPGLVSGRPATTAAAWRPAPVQASDGGRVPAELVWAALDCPGGWTLDLVGRPAVLGQITARVDTRPAADQPCVVMGALLGREGRRAFTATTLYDADGGILARAHAVWFEVDPATFAAR